MCRDQFADVSDAITVYSEVFGDKMFLHNKFVFKFKTLNLNSNLYASAVLLSLLAMHRWASPVYKTRPKPERVHLIYEIWHRKLVIVIDTEEGVLVNIIIMGICQGFIIY